MQARLMLVFLAAAACGDNDDHAHPDAGATADGSTDAPVDAEPCVAGSHLESITSGELVIDATHVQTTEPLTVPLDRTILFTTVREVEPSPKFGGVMCQLHDIDNTQMLPAGITCDRATAGTDTGSGVISVRWTAVTFSSGVTVQRGVANTGLGTPVTVPLNAVDPASTFVLLGGSLTGGSGWGNNEFARARLVDATTLDLRTNTAGSQVSWQVVQMAGARVHRGTASLATADVTGQAAVSANPTDLLLASYTTDNASGIAAATMMVDAKLGGSGVQFERKLGGSAIDVSWEVVRLPFGTKTTTTAFEATEGSKTEAVTGLGASSSVALASSQALLGPSTGATTYAGVDLDLPGEAAFTLQAMAEGVVLQRSATSASASITWTAIDFARECTPL